MTKIFALPLSAAITTTLLVVSVTTPTHAAPDGSSAVINEAYTTDPSANDDPRPMSRTDGVDTDDNAADFTATGNVTPELSVVRIGLLPVEASGGRPESRRWAPIL